MTLLAFFPECSQLQILHIEDQGAAVTLSAQTMAATAACPCCGQLSARIHSRYTRRLTDLPFTSKPVLLLLTCRRFFCSSPACPRQTFAERLPQLTVPYARTTTRLAEAHRHLGFALGGEAGTRLAAKLAMPTSPDTLLRRIRRTELPTPAAATVVGIDDWALRKGQRYGSIVCDLQRHQPIDLLPERSADSVTAWLQEQPQVEIISRDRGDEYIRGANFCGDGSRTARGEVGRVARASEQTGHSQRAADICQRTPGR